MEFDEFEFSVEGFDQSSAVLHPVPAVHVEEIVERTNFGTMDVPANDSVHAALLAELNERLFVVRHVFDSFLGFEFEIRSHGPITKTKAAAHAIERGVEIQNPVVERGANAIEQSIVLGDAVELVAVHDHEAFAVGALVHHAFGDPDRTEMNDDEFLKELIVIACQKSNARVFAVFAQDFLDENVVAVVPKPFAAQSPAINKVSHDVKVGAVRVAEELKQRADLGMFAAKVDIRNPNSAILHIAYQLDTDLQTEAIRKPFRRY